MKTSSKWLTFTLVAIAQFMVVLDSAITNVALPTIKQQLHFTNSTLQWVVTAYALTFGGFLLLGGRAADLYGRRRVLLSGIAAFTFFSFLIGISRSTNLLIVLRALQGMSAAFMSPSALSIVLTTFRDGGEDRNKALAYWTLVATAGAAIGLLLGGALTQYANWRWNFFINVPVGIAISILIYLFVPKHAKADNAQGLDLTGALTITSSLMLFVLGFSQASAWGWGSGRIIGIFSLAVVLVAAFIFNESKVKNPLVPLSIFQIRNVAGANAMMAPMYGTMLGIFFIVTLYMQTVLHYAPFKTGLAFIPFPVLLALMSTRIPKLVAKYGYRRWLIIGPAVVSIGLIWLSRLPVDGGYLLNLLPAFVIVPLGVGMTFMPIIASATSGVPGNRAGLASGLVTTSQMMGGALGLAILSSVAASVTSANLDLGVQSSIVRGFDRAILTAVAFTLVSSALAIFVIRQKSGTNQSPEPQTLDGKHLKVVHES